MKKALKAVAGFTAAGIFFLGLFFFGAFFFGYYSAKKEAVSEDVIAGLIGCISFNVCNSPVLTTVREGERAWVTASMIGASPVSYYLTEQGRLGVVFINAGQSTILLEDERHTGVVSKITRLKEGEPLEVYVFGEPGFDERFALSQQLYLVAMQHADENIVPDSVKRSLKPGGDTIAPKYIPKKGDREA